MAFPQKGSKNIVVEGQKFYYRVSKLKMKSGWREQKDELDATFMEYASSYGLGMVRDATINIAIQLAENPVSDMYIKCYTVLVDGFMGPEQIIEIKPKMVAHLIKKGIKDGWNPEEKGDFRVELAQKWTENKPPVILQLPNMNEGADNYKNLEKPIEITFED